MRKNNISGMSLVEVVIAMALFATVALVMLSHITLYQRNTNFTKERVFAFKKAQTIVNELQGLVEEADPSAPVDLDEYDDGETFNPVLTTVTEGGNALAPDHILSGNLVRFGDWYWSRRVSIEEFSGTNNRNLRYIKVQIFQRDTQGNQDRVAAISAVINAKCSSFPSSQIYDVYFLALENVPGWWVNMDSVKGFMEGNLTELENRNPGLQFRTHWITKLAYGRNPRYTPFINQNTDSTVAKEYAYFYPGTMPTGSTNTFYYTPENFQARVKIDGTITNTVALPPTNPDRVGAYHEYTLADHFNQAMRYHDELALFNQRVAAGDEVENEPTWRILLEQMATNPDKFHNAMLVNLHGEVLPMPPCRNFSDGARDITNYPNVRALTHPEKLRFTRDAANVHNSDDVKLRVHGYLTDMSVATNRVDWVTVDILLNLIDSEGNLTAIDTDCRTGLLLQNSPNPNMGGTMAATATYLAPTAAGNPYGVGCTRIRIQDLPVRHTQPLPGQPGLPTDCRLYGMEYVPCPMGVGGTFLDLSSTSNSPKNTARWVVTIPASTITGHTAGNKVNFCIKTITRLGDASNVAFDWTEGDLENKSVAYSWWADTTEAVPFTERYQMIGDPRHCPYADLMHGGDSFPGGYNPYFDDFSNIDGNAQPRWMASAVGQFNTDSSNGWPYITSRWEGHMEIDVPRFHQLFRTALVNAEILYTDMTGFSGYYLGIGNEIGFDAVNGYAKSIPVDGFPWGATVDTTYYVDNIAGGGESAYRGAKVIRNQTTTAADKWWGPYWIGELYPDRVWDNTATWCAAGSGHEWKTSGNLPTRALSLATAYSFFRSPRNSIDFNSTAGTTMDQTDRRAMDIGSTSLFMHGLASTSTFRYKDCLAAGTLVGAGAELETNYKFTLPGTVPISTPFSLVASGSSPVEWNQTNAIPHYNASLLQTYYEHSTDWYGSALIGLAAPSMSLASDRAFILLNGMDRSTDTGSPFIGPYSLVTMLHSFFEAGMVATGSRIKQLPRVQIMTPTEVTTLENPSAISIIYRAEWTRWDGNPYTSTTNPAFAENENDLIYVLLYSDDDGVTWKYIRDDTVATPGIVPGDANLILADSVVGDESYNWSVPTLNFPDGSYLVRVDCFRSDEAMHYATHTVSIYIER